MIRKVNITLNFICYQFFSKLKKTAVLQTKMSFRLLEKDVENSQMLDERKDCPICFEPCNQCSVELPCKHQYHYRCLSEYVTYCQKDKIDFKCSYCNESYSFTEKGKLFREKFVITILKKFLLSVFNFVVKLTGELSVWFTFYNAMVLIVCSSHLSRLYNSTLCNESNHDVNLGVWNYIYNGVIDMFTLHLIMKLLIYCLNFFIFFLRKYEDEIATVLVELVFVLSPVYVFYSDKNSNILIYYFTFIITLLEIVTLFLFLSSFVHSFVVYMYGNFMVDTVDLHVLKDINMSESNV